MTLDAGVPRLRSFVSITGFSTFGISFVQFASYPHGREVSICKFLGAALIVATSSPFSLCNIRTPSFAFSGGFPLTSKGCFATNPTPLPMRTRKNEPPLDFGPTTHRFLGGRPFPTLPGFLCLRRSSRVCGAQRPAWHVAHQPKPISRSCGPSTTVPRGCSRVYIINSFPE
jgi:hypothetical protein